MSFSGWVSAAQTPYTHHDVADFQTDLLTFVNEVSYFLKLFFQKSSGRQSWGPQSQPTGPQCASVPFNTNRHHAWVAPELPLTTVHCKRALGQEEQAHRLQSGAGTSTADHAR